MELGEVVNPHYAFPVVGVILCVLLVFAFGFKSPVQPPSFDGLEEEKKPVSKKRTKSAKSKETNKIKTQQNGKVGGSPSNKQVIDAGISQNIPNNKSADKQAAKTESKNKRNKTVSSTLRQKQDHAVINKVKNTNATNEDGWVQQLSKKERKHRRKEEVANASSITETDKYSENDMWDEQQLVTELSSCSQESTPSKSSPKQPMKMNTSNVQNLSHDLQGQKESKKKIKKETKGNQNEMNNTYEKYKESPTETNKVETKTDLKQYDISNSSMQIKHELEEEISSSEDKSSKKKKGKKKNQETHTSIVKSKPIEEISENTKNSIETMDSDLSNISSNENIAPNANSTTNSISKYEEKTETSQITESGSNVIFDELGDIWQDAKSQKRKKKTRRE